MTTQDASALATRLAEIAWRINSPQGISYKNLTELFTIELQAQTVEDDEFQFRVITSIANQTQIIGDLRALVGRMKTAGSAMIAAWDDGTGTCKQDDAVSLMQQAIEEAEKIVN